MHAAGDRAWALPGRLKHRLNSEHLPGNQFSVWWTVYMKALLEEVFQGLLEQFLAGVTGLFLLLPLRSRVGSFLYRRALLLGGLTTSGPLKQIGQAALNR